jgi:hypothetical protein
MIENAQSYELNNVNLTGFPRGFAILSYSNIYSTNIDSLTTGYVVLKNIISPLPAQKGQRIGEIPIIGRNTDVMQSMGGKGLIYPEIQFMLKDDGIYDIVDGVAHQTMLKIAGWCDAGEPLFFAYEKMIRRVLIFDYEFHENKSDHWYDCKLTLKKYVPIEPLAYQRTIVDLAPFPDLPVPTDPTQPGTGSGGGSGSGERDILKPGNTPEESGGWKIWKWNDSSTGKTGSISVQLKSDGSVNCTPHTLTEKDLESTIDDLITKYYGAQSGSITASIQYTLMALATTRNGIDLLRLFSNETSLDDIPISKRTICIPRVVKINKDGNEVVVKAK